MSSNATVSLIATLPPTPSIIAQITAPLMFGILFSWFMYGMLVVQVYLFHICFCDTRAIKAFVYSVFFLDTLQTAMQGGDAFYWFCSGFGDLTHLSNVYISFFDTPMLGATLALMVQTFFCYRISILSKSKILPALIFLVCLMSTVAAYLSGIRGHLGGNLSASQADINSSILEVWLIGGAVADTIIAGVMIYLLLRSRGAYRNTNDILHRLVRLTMETNSLSASLAILTIILYFGAPNTSYFITPTYLLGKCYSNTLLVTLNNRFFLSGDNVQVSKPANCNASGTGSNPIPTFRVPRATNFASSFGDSSTNSQCSTYKVDSFGEQDSTQLAEMPVEVRVTIDRIISPAN